MIVNDVLISSGDRRSVISNTHLHTVAEIELSVARGGQIFHKSWSRLKMLSVGNVTQRVLRTKKPQMLRVAVKI